MTGRVIENKLIWIVHGRYLKAVGMWLVCSWCGSVCGQYVVSMWLVKVVSKWSVCGW